MLDLDCFLSKEDFVNPLGRIKVTGVRSSPYEYTTVEGMFLPNEHCNCRCVIGVSRDPIKKVIFNDPATIVYWKDGSKTVVKCGPDDVFDAEKGLAMAITKKHLGNRGNYNNILKKHMEDKE